MLQKVSFLSESDVATFIGASKRLLSSVDTDVVNEVLPLAECLVAAVEWALHKRKMTLALGVLQSDNLEFQIGRLALD